MKLFIVVASVDYEGGTIKGIYSTLQEAELNCRAEIEIPTIEEDGI